MRSLLNFILLLVLIPSGFAQDKSISFLRLGSDIIGRKLKLQPSTNEDRVAALRKLFSDAGCGSRLAEEAVPKSLPTISCATRSTSDYVIVVTAPIEYSAKGDDAALRWGDATLLPVLAESLGSVLTRHSFVFVGLTGKGDGEEGAKYYLAQLSPEQKKKIHAVIAFDHVGRGAPNYAVRGTESGMEFHTYRRGGIASQNVRWSPDEMPLTRSIATAAQRWGYAVPGKTDSAGANLTKPFFHDNIPAITFSSPSWVITGHVGNNDIRDYRTKLDPIAYNEAYLFLCAYLLHLDRDMGRDLPAPGSEALTEQAASPSLVPPATQEPLAVGPVAPPPTATAPPVQAAPVTNLPVASAPVVSIPAQSTSSTAPVFRATTRLVQVDVVATDGKGKPITDLQRNDFTVLQDGHPQNLHVFEVHTGTPSIDNRGADEKEKPALGTYSNFPAGDTTQARTILLFDMLNTPSEDQQVARKQLLKLAQQLPKGQPVALFALTGKLVMVAGFTANPDEVALAINNLLLQNSQLLTAEAERQHRVGDVNNVVVQSLPSIPANAGVNQDTIRDAATNQAARLLQQYQTMESSRIEQRVIFTLDAFSALSRAVAGYPGRKNLVWLSGSFPVSVEPNSSTNNEWRANESFRQELSQAIALLTQSRVAVYPVDIRGMQLRGVDISTGTSESSAFVGGGAMAPGSYSNDKTGSLLSAQAVTAANERQAMTEVAEQTGGRAFVNTNDFRGAITRAMADGANYYTLAYSPEGKDERATYHRIEVKLNRPDVKLSYRRGYYSLPETGNAKTGLAALQGALQPGMPPATMLFFTANVKPKSGGIEIHYSINPSNITLEDADKATKHLLLDCMAIAFDREGKEAAHASDTLDATIPSSALEATLSRGVPASEEVDLKPGVYNLRVGVQDRASERIGTLEIPITVE
jgi:VWFA-related protein